MENPTLTDGYYVQALKICISFYQELLNKDIDDLERSIFVHLFQKIHIERKENEIFTFLRRSRVKNTVTREKLEELEKSNPSSSTAVIMRCLTEKSKQTLAFNWAIFIVRS